MVTREQFEEYGRLLDRALWACNRSLHLLAGWVIAAAVAVFVGAGPAREAAASLSVLTAIAYVGSSMNADALVKRTKKMQLALFGVDRRREGGT